MRYLLAVLMFTQPLFAHPRKRIIVAPPRVIKKVIVKKRFFEKIIPTYFVSYNPTIRPSAILIQPPEIRVSPTVVNVTNPSVQVEQRRQLVQQDIVQQRQLVQQLPAFQQYMAQFPQQYSALGPQFYNLEAILYQLRQENVTLRRDVDLIMERLRMSRTQQIESPKSIHSIFKKSCFECHNSRTKEGDLILFDEKEQLIIPKGREIDMIYSKVIRGQMPKMPNKFGIKELSEKEVIKILDWLDELSGKKGKKNDQKDSPRRRSESDNDQRE